MNFEGKEKVFYDCAKEQKWLCDKINPHSIRRAQK
jgi:hypothetical protein